MLARASDGRWEGVSALPPDRARHTDGGYLDLFSEPLTIVYGTALPDRAGVLREAAMALSDWAPTAAIPIGVKTGAFRVLADTQVTERDLQRGSLLLLGDAGENTWTGPVLDSLPVRWANGVLESAGQRTRGDALLAVYPSPYAPQHRAAVLTLPPGLRTGDRVLYYAMLRVRGYNVDQTATRVILHPDVMIFDSVGALNGGPVAWAAVWDRTWSTLREVK